MKKNYFKNLLLSGFFMANSIGTFAQISFTNSNYKFVTSTNSGCPTAVVDWNNDGLDDIVRLDQGKTVFVEVQRTNQTFQSISLGSFVGNSGWAWGMCVVDLDHNGYKDIIVGGSGSGGVKVMMINNAGTSGTISQLPNSTFFLQNITAGDFNNDGWIDLFCCDDNAASHIYLNNGAGVLQTSSIINFDVSVSDDSGNYGSVWTDFDNDGDMDLYIAKCRQGVNDPADFRRINVLFVNNGNGTYTESAAIYNLNIGWQSWTASPGDIDNDGDIDFLITNHDYVSQILLNDGTGHYTDITATTGFDISDITPIQSVMEDFDNDGFIDLFITGSNARYYKNNGNLTFTRVEGLFNSGNMASFAIGDANHDGAIDIFGLYNNIYTTPTNVNDVLWLNNKNDYNFINFDLRGTTSNHGAIGAKVTIYGPWGVQVREVRAGESYGSVNSSILHFGLGENESIDSAVIRWPSGGSQILFNIAADQFVVITENDCVSPGSMISGSNILCPGNSAILSATVSGLNYLWSTGATTQAVEITETGEYNVSVSSSQNSCNAVSRTITVTSTPDSLPVISHTGFLHICSGESIQLLAPEGLQNYQWSNGQNTQNISVDQSGDYTLVTQGICEELSSNTINLTVLSPENPNYQVVNVPEMGLVTVELNTNNTSINWYDASGGNLIGTGNPFETTVNSINTTLYAQGFSNFGGGIFPAGKTNFNGANQYSSGSNTNAETYFEVFEPCTLKTVKVYTDRPGNRNIQLKTLDGTLVTSTLANVPMDSSNVLLNWIILPGSYNITTEGSVNQIIPNNANAVNPRLRRNNTNTGVSYPYLLENVLSITGNNLGPALYYYFYDWKVEKFKVECTSTDFIPIDIVVSPTGVSNVLDNSIALFPNPTTGILNVNLKNSSNSILNLFDASGRKVMSKNLINSNNTIDLFGLAKGIYQVQVLNGDNVITKKLSIQ